MTSLSFQIYQWSKLMAFLNVIFQSHLNVKSEVRKSVVE